MRRKAEIDTDTKKQINHPSKTKWEEYNKDSNGKEAQVVRYENGVMTHAKSYSHLFFDKFRLNTYLKPDSKIIQFGAATGRFLEDYKDKCDVMGYDYSDTAIRILTNKNIPNRQIDLNDTVATQSCLTQDIDNSAINFIAVRVLQYLDNQALAALIFTLINKAAPNSRFFIINSIGDTRDGQTLLKNYVPSFFGPRTDMAFSLATQTPEKLANIPSDEHVDEEVLVVQKL